MGMITEFKEFAMKGNVVDMAVGIIIGAAFGKIVSSFVNDVLMPPLGLLMGGVDFSDMGTVLKDAAGEADAGGAQVGRLRANDRRFPHRCVRDLYCNQSYEQHAP